MVVRTDIWNIVKEQSKHQRPIEEMIVFNFVRLGKITQLLSLSLSLSNDYLNNNNIINIYSLAMDCE